ncbi:MAG: hypothetical protein U0R64_07285 [Candidatus Nanopelagicales bacterium]
MAFHDLPWWGCVLLAFIPPAIIAFIAYRLSQRVNRDNDNLMTSAGRFSGAALVFLCAFLVGTIWTQTTAYLEGWRVEYRTALELQRAAEILAPNTSKPLVAAVDNYLTAVRDHEVDPDQPWQDRWTGAPAVTDAALATNSALTTLSATMPRHDAAALTAIGDRLIQARDRRVELSLQPGVPDLVMIVVMLLAWCATLCLAMFPPTSQLGVKRFQTIMIVVIVGLVQVPVYYLGATESVNEFVTTLLSR